MILENTLTILDEDGGQLTVEFDGALFDGGGFNVSDEDGTRILMLTKEDSEALVQFLRRYGVSA